MWLCYVVVKERFKGLDIVEQGVRVFESSTDILGKGQRGLT